MKIGFIGLGNMAKAMIGGMLREKIVEAGDIIGSAKTRETMKRMEEEFSITAAESNRHVAEYADVIILAVKPVFFPEVIGEIKEAVTEEKLVVSIAAGKNMEWIEKEFVFLFIEAMADGAVKAGMPRKQAYEFAASAVAGSARMVMETGLHPGELKDMVCSPGGTTIEGIAVLEEKGMRAAVMEAVGACVEKSKKL